MASDRDTLRTLASAVFEGTAAPGDASKLAIRVVRMLDTEASPPVGGAAPTPKAALDIIRHIAELETEEDHACRVCFELLDRPENDNGDGEWLGHTIDCPVPEAQGYMRGVSTAVLARPTAGGERARFEALRWIAQQRCEQMAEGSDDTLPCSETGACITEWCHPCRAAKALEVEPATPPRMVGEEPLAVSAEKDLAAAGIRREPATPEPRRSRHFSNEAIDQGTFPAHISKSGPVYAEPLDAREHITEGRGLDAAIAAQYPTEPPTRTSTRGAYDEAMRGSPGGRPDDGLADADGSSALSTEPDPAPPPGYQEPFQIPADQPYDPEAWFIWPDGYDSKASAIKAQHAHKRGVLASAPNVQSCGVADCNEEPTREHRGLIGDLQVAAAALAERELGSSDEQECDELDMAVTAMQDAANALSTVGAREPQWTRDALLAAQRRVVELDAELAAIRAEPTPLPGDPARYDAMLEAGDLTYKEAYKLLRRTLPGMDPPETG